jgi:hypothetical protein
MRHHTPYVAWAEARNDRKAIEVVAFMMEVDCQRATKLDEEKESAIEDRKRTVSLFLWQIADQQQSE